MSGGVSDYAALSARVRVKYGMLLSDLQLHALRDSPDLIGLMESLKRTSYGQDLEQVHSEQDLVAATRRVLRRRQAREARSIIQAAPGICRRILAQFFRKHEVNNLKAVLRGIAAADTTGVDGAWWGRVRSLLFPVEATQIPAERMLEAGSIQAAIELLRGTPYYEVLAFALKRYTAEQSLFPLEVALDLDYWRRLWFEARRLSGEDQTQALRVIGSLVDSMNLMWVIRYRVYKGLSEEELINYTLPFGRRVRDEDVRSLAAGANPGAVVTRIFPEISDAGRLLEDPRGGLPRLEAELRRIVARRCMASFLGSPFHVGLPLAYLELHDLEIQDLTILLEAKSTGLDETQFLPFMTSEAMATA